MEAGKNGVTAITPKNILFGAGTIHFGLKYTAGKEGAAGTWNFKESIVGATSGGSKFSIVPNVYVPNIDGVDVPVKQLKKKTGGKATMEVNFAETTKQLLKMATLAAEGASEDASYDLLVDSSDIPEDAVAENIAFVGVELETNKPVIAIMDNPMVTNGFDNEFKHNEAMIGKYTFECQADLENADAFDKLPWRIYWPKTA